MRTSLGQFKPTLGQIPVPLALIPVPPALIPVPLARNPVPLALLKRGFECAARSRSSVVVVYIFSSARSNGPELRSLRVSFTEKGMRSREAKAKAASCQKGRFCAGSIDSSWVLERQLARISTQVTQETTSTKNARRNRPSCRDPALCPGPWFIRFQDKTIHSTGRSPGKTGS